MEEWIKKSDVVKAFEDVLDCDFFHVSEETPRERINSIPFVQVPPKPKDDVIGYRWVLKWDLKELWTGLR